MSEPADKFIEIKISAAANRILDGTAWAHVLPRVMATMDEQNELTVGASSKNRMSFPRSGRPTLEGLRVQSNTLRRSINRSLTRAQGNGTVSGIGSNVPYFGVHEFGFSGSQTVKSHTRQNPRGLRQGKGGSRVSLAFGEAAGGFLRPGALGAGRQGKAVKGFRIIPSGGSHTVRSFSREMNLPARQMVRRTIEERAENYRAALGNAVNEGFST